METPTRKELPTNQSPLIHLFDLLYLIHLIHLEHLLLRKK
jgi:hypothetical protein